MNIKSELFKKDFENYIDTFGQVYKKIEPIVSKEFFKNLVNYFPALVYIESRYKPDAIGSSGEIGLAQILKSTALRIYELYKDMFDIEINLGNIKDVLKNPYYNLLIASLILWDNYRKSDFNFELAIQRYNSSSAWLSKTGSQKGKEYLERIKKYV